MDIEQARQILEDQVDQARFLGSVLFFENGESYVGFDINNNFTIIEAAKVAAHPNSALYGLTGVPANGR